MLEKTVQLYEEHQLHPPIGARFRWEDAKEAFAKLVDQSIIGKIVVEVGSSSQRKIAMLL